jgi:hypothetical protein
MTNLYISLCLLLQEARDGVEPLFINVYMEGHRGPDPEHAEILCDDSATEKLVGVINNYLFLINL